MPLILLKTGPVTIYSFGVILFLSFFAWTFLVWLQIKNKAVSQEKVFDVLLLSSFMALIGARIGYVFTNWPVFSADFSRIILINHYAGLDLAWGLIYGWLTVILTTWSAKLPVLEILDVFSLIAILIRRQAFGFAFSCYLILSSISFLILLKPVRQDTQVIYLTLLFSGLIVFVMKFPASVLTQIKGYLETKAKDAQERLKTLKKEDPFEDKSRLLDRASEDSEAQSKAGHERIEALQQQLNMVLVQTRKALTKIKVGKYGICESCGKMIDTDRLAAMPTATMCMACSKKKER